MSKSMTPEEFDEFMDGTTQSSRNAALNGLSPDKISVKFQDPREQQGVGDSFNQKLTRLTLRLLWLAGWAWMIFTFGWVGHVAVQLAEKALKED